MPICSGCREVVQEGWKYCRFCGHDLASQSPDAESSLGRYLPPDDLMRRMEPREMQGLLNKTVVVEEGQSALFFIGGRHDLTLGPGKHSVGNILSSRGRDAEIVLFRTSDVPIEVSIPSLLSTDPLPLSLDFRLVLKIEEPIGFWRNLASGAGSYASRHLAAAIYAPVEEGCEAFVGSRSIRELGGRNDTGKNLVLALASHMEQPLSRWGLRLVSTLAANIQCEAWDEVGQARSQYFVAAAERQAELEGRKRLFDVYQESQVQTLAEETAAVVGVEKRFSLWQRLRQAILSNAQGEISSQSDLEDLVRQADKDRLLQQDEYETLLRTLAEAKEDHQKGRAFVLRRVETEGEHELRKLELDQRYGLSRERLSLEVATARQEMEGTWELELRRVDLEIEQQRRLAHFQREQEALGQELQGRTQVEEATASAAVAEIERGQEAKDLEMLINTYGQYKGVKRQDELERLRAELDAEERRQTMALAAKEHEVEIGLKESREHHSQELQRINALSHVGIETLIAVSGPEQSTLLAQLARTRALSACSPQQILAMQAESSPQVVDALREMLTATAAAGQLDQYERLVTEIKESASASREDYQRNISTLSEMFNKALDSVKDTAVAFSSFASSTSQRPDVRSQASPDGTVTLLFSDLEGSTAMTERLGDRDAQEVLRDHNTIVRRQLEDSGGFEVKSMGDGFMLAFSSGRSGLECAVGIQRSFSSYNTGHPAEPLRVRIGIHTGEAIKEGEDFFGKNVILASRISAKAQGGQIFVSSLFKEITESGVDIRFGEMQEVELKGLAGMARIYPVLWD